MESVKDVLGRWGRNVREATKKAEDLAENTWQHCKYIINFHCSRFVFGFTEVYFCVCW